jgi:hypothetical protein
VTHVTSKFILCSIIAILSASIAVIPLAAQTGSLRLEGIVWDPSGNPLSGVALTVADQNTGRLSETISDSDGYYRFLSLEPGVYTLSAKAKGLKDVIHRDLYLFSPGSTSENISFELSAIDKEGGPSERTRLTDSDVAGSLTQRDIDALPLLNRDPLSLSLYQPGVQIFGGNETQSVVNGTQTTMNAISRDGISLTDPMAPKINFSLLSPISDSISSFQLITAAANAEFGGAGGAQYVITSRAGTKQWSGNLYNYYRNQYLNSNEYFHNNQGIAKPEYTRNLFGGTLSGKIGKKLQIFGAFEGNRTDQQLYRNRLVLTDDAKLGKFKWYSPDDTIRDEDTVRTYDIDGQDSIGIDPAIANILKLMPDSNNYYIGDDLNTAGYEFYADTFTHRERADFRLDYDLNSRHRLFFRFSYDQLDATDSMNNGEPSFPGMKSGRLGAHDFGFFAGSNYTISPTKVNELRIGFLRTATDYKRPDRTSELMTISSAWTNPLHTSFPKSYRYPSFEITDNFSHAKNVHALKYGFSMRRSSLDSLDYNGAYPNATFSNQHGNAPADTIGPSLDSIISENDRDTFEKLYNNLLGRVESVTQTFQSNRKAMLPAGSGKDRKFSTFDFSGFIQDSWKIKPTLTLNLGIRYEFRTTPKEANGYQVVLDQASKINNAANISDFNIVSSSNWYAKNSSNFAPRVGFAWDIFGTASTVLRGAYGIHYDPLNGGITNFIDNNSYGLSQTITQYPNSSGTDIRLSDLPAITQPALPSIQPEATRSASIAVLDPNLKTPRVHQFQFTLERRLFGAIVEVGYTRTQGKKLFQYLNLNQTKTTGEFLAAFKELQAYRTSGTPISSTNSIVKIFGSPEQAGEALELHTSNPKISILDSGQVGMAADIIDRNYYNSYQAAGISDYYIRNFPQFDKFIYGTNAAESWYNAVRIGIKKSTANYGLRAFYTWSKSMDTASSDGSGMNVTFDSASPRSNKAYSDFDRTHVLNVSWDYRIPFGRDLDEDSDMPRWVNALFAGWNFGSLWTWESGQRFSVYSGLENQFAGTMSLANLDRSTSKKIGSLSQYGGTVYWLDPDTKDLFTYPEAGEQGDSERNSFRGPRFFNLDIVFHKRFTVRENQYLQFRLEGYNLLDNTHFSIPNNYLNDSNFGIITSTQGSPRILQVALKYLF